MGAGAGMPMPQSPQSTMAIAAEDTRTSWCTYPTVSLFPMQIGRAAAVVLIQGGYCLSNTISECDAGLPTYQSASERLGNFPMVAQIGGAAAVVTRIFLGGPRKSEEPTEERRASWL